MTNPPSSIAADQEPQRSTDERVPLAAASPRKGVRFIEIDGSVLANALFPHDIGFRMLNTDAPPDIEIVEVRPDPSRQGVFKIKVASFAWTEVPAGMVIPTWTPTMVSRWPE